MNAASAAASSLVMWNSGIAGCPTTIPSTRASSISDALYSRAMMRKGGAGVNGLAPVLSILWHLAQLVSAIMRPDWMRDSLLQAGPPTVTPESSKRTANGLSIDHGRMSGRPRTDLDQPDESLAFIGPPSPCSGRGV